MARCGIHLVAIVLLALTSVDLIGVDCLADGRASSAVACAALSESGEDGGTPGGECWCCTAAEAAGPAGHVGPTPACTPWSPGRTAGPCAGVRPVPYHPPLLLG
jgi:hypothetical protein